MNSMESEVFRPTRIEDIVGHAEPKAILQKYLHGSFAGAVFLVGSPGIGKTTLALCAAKSYGFEPLEINASRQLRNYADVERLRASCQSPFQISSMVFQSKKRTCVILDELDGSDPHAHTKILAWIKDPDRHIPILCTGNDLPSMFKRNKDYITAVRCFPPRLADIQSMFGEDVSEISKECHFDIRRIRNRFQYGESDALPKYKLPPTGLSPEETFIRRQAMFGLPEHQIDTLDTAD